jgi:hypothetical protein
MQLLIGFETGNHFNTSSVEHKYFISAAMESSSGDFHFQRDFKFRCSTGGTATVNCFDDRGVGVRVPAESRILIFPCRPYRV